MHRCIFEKYVQKFHLIIIIFIHMHTKLSLIIHLGL